MAIDERLRTSIQTHLGETLKHSAFGQIRPPPASIFAIFLCSLAVGILFAFVAIPIAVDRAIAHGDSGPSILVMAVIIAPFAIVLSIGLAMATKRRVLALTDRHLLLVALNGRVVETWPLQTVSEARRPISPRFAGLKFKADGKAIFFYVKGADRDEAAEAEAILAALTPPSTE